MNERRMTKLARTLSVGLAIGLAACGNAFTTDPFGTPDTSAASSSSTGLDGVGGVGGAGGSFDGPGGAGGAVNPMSGSGGSGCDDSDADKDGVSACAGDCDDTDPLTYPKAIELCGDGVANDCSALEDPEYCQGLGTFVAGALGLDTNPGTKEKPLKTIEAGMSKSALLKKQPVLVAAAAYAPQNGASPGAPAFSLKEGISLLGGFRCDAMLCDWQRAPKVHETILDAVDGFGVHAANSLTGATVVEGFTIRGKDVKQDVGDVTSVSAVTLGGAPTFRGNIVRGPTVSGAAAPLTVALRVTQLASSGEAALVAENLIIAGDGPAATVAVAVSNGAKAKIARNDIRGGKGLRSRAVVFRAGVGPSTLVRNQIAAGACVLSGSSFGVSLEDTVSSEVVVDGNRINVKPDLVGDGTLCSAAERSGGIESRGSSATLTNNIVRGLPSGIMSVGLLLAEGETKNGSPNVNANTFDMTGSLGSSALVWQARKGTLKSGRLRNNILIGAGPGSYCGYVDASVGIEGSGPEILENNDLWGKDAVLFWSGSVTYLSIDMVNGPTLNAQKNVSVDPMLDATYHLTTDACLDLGTTIEAPKKDFEGDDRPLGKGVDLGADEKG